MYRGACLSYSEFSICREKYAPPMQGVACLSIMETLNVFLHVANNRGSECLITAVRGGAIRMRVRMCCCADKAMLWGEPVACQHSTPRFHGDTQLKPGSRRPSAPHLPACVFACNGFASVRMTCAPAVYAGHSCARPWIHEMPHAASCRTWSWWRRSRRLQHGRASPPASWRSLGCMHR
jgi:hypothetical protein